MIVKDYEDMKKLKGFTFKELLTNGTFRTLKKSSYKICLCDDFGNVKETYYLNKKEFYSLVHYNYDNETLYKAYIKGCLYSRHSYFSNEAVTR